MRADLIKRTFVTTFGIAILAYLFWLYSSGIIIVKSEFETYNLLTYIILAIVSVYYIIIYGIYPIHVKRHKRTFFVIGIGLIFGSATYLVDQPEQSIFIGDFIKVLGVLLVVFGSTGYLIPQKSKLKKEESEMEIIEA